MIKCVFIQKQLFCSGKTIKGKNIDDKALIIKFQIINYNHTTFLLTQQTIIYK